MKLRFKNYKTYKAYFVEWNTKVKKYGLGFTASFKSLRYIGYDIKNSIYMFKILWFQYNSKANKI